jgi:hypothetical protein
MCKSHAPVSPARAGPYAGAGAQPLQTILVVTRM